MTQARPSSLSYLHLFYLFPLPVQCMVRPDPLLHAQSGLSWLGQVSRETLVGGVTPLWELHFSQ
jgi:hypothetical protein